LDNWFVYIIETENDRLYTGITNNLEQRFEKHLSGKGAKFFRSDKPKKIVYSEAVKDRSDALKREHAIKKLTRTKKLELIKQAIS
jgi:putative endonuclease